MGGWRGGQGRERLCLEMAVRGSLPLQNGQGAHPLVPCPSRAVCSLPACGQQGSPDCSHCCCLPVLWCPCLCAGSSCQPAQSVPESSHLAGASMAVHPMQSTAPSMLSAPSRAPSVGQLAGMIMQASGVVCCTVKKGAARSPLYLYAMHALVVPAFKPAYLLVCVRVRLPSVQQYRRVVFHDIPALPGSTACLLLCVACRASTPPPWTPRPACSTTPPTTQSPACRRARALPGAPLPGLPAGAWVAMLGGRQASGAPHQGVK